MIWSFIQFPSGKIKLFFKNFIFFQKNIFNKGDNMIKLNIGCGYDIKKDFINLDRYNYPGVDIICDLNEGKLPFNDNSIDYILASNIFEHLFCWEDIIKECYRILKPSGQIEIRVPYKTRAFTSPYHIRYFNLNTMNYFSKRGNIKKIKTGFDDELDFIMKKRFVNRYDFNYHFMKYFNKNWRIPIGYKNEIVWILEKPNN